MTRIIAFVGNVNYIPFIDWYTVAAFGLPFLLYIFTLAPTVYNLDSAELTTAAATGGIVRATGYPLYLMLGWLWSWLPIGDVGYRLNLFSAFSGALTIALAERILRRLGVGAWAAFGALGLLACSTYFWGLSLIAEVYTLHTVLMAALILLLLRWGEKSTSWRLAFLGLTVGLSFGHHGAIILLIPGAAWYILSIAPRQAFRPQSLLLATGAVLLGLSVYFYIPVRYGASPAFNYAGFYDATGTFQPINLRTWAGFWWLVSGQAFSGNMFAYQNFALWREFQRFGAELWRAFFAIGIGPGILGGIVLIRRDWRLGGTLLLMFACHTFFFINYRVNDKATMFLPSYLIWALWLGLGYQWLLDWLRTEAEILSQQWETRIFRGVIMSTVLLAFLWNVRLLNLSNDWSVRALGETILSEVEPNALIIANWSIVPPVQYLQLVEGQRPDVQTINRFLISQDNLNHLINQELLNHRPVYVDYFSTYEVEGIQKVEFFDSLYRLEKSPDNQIVNSRYH